MSVFHGHHGGAAGTKPFRAALALAGHDRYKQFDVLISSQPISLIWVHVDQHSQQFHSIKHTWTIWHAARTAGVLKANNQEVVGAGSGCCPGQAVMTMSVRLIIALDAASWSWDVRQTVMAMLIRPVPSSIWGVRPDALASFPKRCHISCTWYIKRYYSHVCICDA